MKRLASSLYCGETSFYDDNAELVYESETASLSPTPVDIKLWTRSGEIQCWNRCISLRYDFYKGTRRMKLLDSNEIRQLRDVCVFEINGMEVFM